MGIAPPSVKYIIPLAGGTKSKAWKFALANVPKTDWLPPELRGRGYAAVGAKAKTAKKSKK